MTIAWLLRWRGWPHDDERVFAWIWHFSPCVCDFHLKTYRKRIGTG